jgi:hypothetical protein
LTAQGAGGGGVAPDVPVFGKCREQGHKQGAHCVVVTEPAIDPFAGALLTYETGAPQFGQLAGDG